MSDLKCHTCNRSASVSRLDRLETEVKKLKHKLELVEEKVRNTDTQIDTLSLMGLLPF